MTKTKQRITDNRSTEHRVPVLVNRPLYNKVKRYATKKCMTMTAIVNQALQQWMETQLETERALLTMQKEK
jgi:hypothetical protein